MPSIIIPNENNPTELEKKLLNNPDAYREKEVFSGIKHLYSSPVSMSADSKEGWELPSLSWSPEYYRNLAADNQSWVNKTMHGVGRAVTVLGFEVAKMVPGIIGLGIAVGGNILSGDVDLFDNFAGQGTDEDNFDGMSWINNKAVQWLDEKEQAAKENPYLAIYSNSAYDKMNWTEKLSKVDFWATQGADGVGFMASIFFPGAVLKALGIAGKVARGASVLGKSAELFQVGKEAQVIMKTSTLLTEGEKIAEAAQKLGTTVNEIGKGLDAMKTASGVANTFSKQLRWMKPAWQVKDGASELGKTVDLFTTAGANGLFESASEANESMNTLKLQLEQERSQGLNQYSDDKIQELASNAAATTFQYNMPLLLVSNLLLESVILNKFDNFLGIGKRTAKEAEETAIRVGKEFANQSTEKSLAQYMKDNIKAYGMGDLAKETLFKIVLAAPKEGLMEEGLQNSIQRYAKKVAFLGDNASVSNDLAGIVNQYKTSFSDLGDNEFWESVALGAILGGLGEAGIRSNINIAVNGGTANIDYNRRLFGGEAREKPSRIGAFLGKEEKSKEEGIISSVEQLMRNGFNSDPKQFFEKDEKGEIKYNKETGKPTLLPEYVNSFLATSIFQHAKIDELGKQIEGLKGEKISDKGEFNEIINSQIDSNIENIQAEKDAVEDSILYNHFSHLFDLGMFSEDMTKTVMKNLVDREKARIKESNPMITDDVVDNKLKAYESDMNTKMKEYESIYKEVKEASNYYFYFNPKGKDKPLYDEFVSKNINSMYAHLLLKRQKDKVVSSIENHITKLDNVKAGFQELNDEMQRMYNETDVETITDPIAKERFKEFKKEYAKMTDMEESFKSATIKELEEDAKDQFKSFGSTGINNLTEDEYVKLYVKDAQESRKEYTYRDKDRKTGKEYGPVKKGKKNSVFNDKLNTRRSMFRFQLLQRLLESPELLTGFTKLQDVKGLIANMLQQNYSPDIIRQIDKAIEDLNKNKSRITSEINISRSYYYKASRPEIAEQRFNEYKDKLKKREEYVNETNKDINNLYKLLEASDYVSGADRRNYAVLDSNKTRTEDEEKEYLRLKDKVINPTNNKLRPVDYDLIDGKLVTGEGERRGLLFKVRDLYNLDDLTSEEKKEYYKLKDIETLTEQQTTRLNQIISKLPEIQIMARTESWKDSDGKDQFITKLFVIKDTGLSSGVDNLKVNSKGEWKNMTINSRAFFERFANVKVLDHSSPERAEIVAKKIFYRKHRMRLQKIKAGERILSELPENIARNQEIHDKILPMFEFLVNAKLSESNSAEELLGQLDQLLTQFEINNNIIDKVELANSIKKLKELSWKDKKKLTLEELSELEGINAVDLAVIAYIQEKSIEENPTVVDILAADALSKYASDETKVINGKAVTTDSYLKQQFRKKDKMYYLIKNLRNTLNSAKKIELVDGTPTTKLDNTTIQLAKSNMLDILANNLMNIEEDNKNLQLAIDKLEEINDMWRSEEFDIKKLYEEMTTKFRDISKGISEMGLSLGIGNIPNYISDVRTRINQIEKIIEKAKERSSGIDNENSINSIIGSIDYFTQLVSEMRDLYTQLTESEKEQGAREIKLLESKINKLEKEVKAFFDNLEPVSRDLDSARDHMLNYFITNSFYKKLYKSFGSVKQSEVRRNDEYEELKKYPSLSGQVDSLFTISTNDVQYVEDWRNGILRINDDVEEIDYEGRTIVVPKLTEELSQLAFQKYLGGYDVMKYNLINFGVTYLLASGKIKKTGDKYELGNIEGNEVQHRTVFLQLVDTMNKYVDKLDKSSIDFATLIERLETANYVVPFHKDDKEFYEDDGTYAITALMSPENRILKVRNEGLLAYIKKDNDLMRELEPVIGDIIETTIDGKKRYIKRAKFNEAMRTKSEVIRDIVSKHFVAYSHGLSALPIQKLETKRFSKGFRYRVKEKSGAYFYRNFTKEDKVKQIFVIQRKERVEGEKSNKATSTSNVFYGEEYFGLVAARYDDESEELLKVRNVTQDEAETVATLLYLRFKGLDVVDGQHLFPYQVDKEEWHKGLINSLIRYGTTQGLESETKKMSNKSNWSQKKKQYVETDTARSYDIWMSTNAETRQEQINWIDDQGNKLTINASDAIQVENGNVTFNRSLITFLKSKHFNVSSDVNRAGKKEIFVPYLNKTELLAMLKGSKDTSPILIQKIDNTKEFYMLGNDKTEAPTQTSSINERPKIVGRTVTVNPDSENFRFEKKEKKLDGATKNNNFEKLEDTKISDVQDGNYQIEVKGILYDVEIKNGEIVEKQEDLDPILDEYREKYKDKGQSDQGRILIRDLTKYLNDYKEALTKKDLNRALDIKNTFIRKIGYALLNRYLIAGDFKELLDKVDFSTDKYTNSEIRKMISEAREAIKSFDKSKLKAQQAKIDSLIKTAKTKQDESGYNSDAAKTARKDVEAAKTELFDLENYESSLTENLRLLILSEAGVKLFGVANESYETGEVKSADNVFNSKGYTEFLKRFIDGLSNNRNFKRLQNYTLYGKVESKVEEIKPEITKPNAVNEIKNILAENISVTEKLQKLEKYASETKNYEDESIIEDIFKNNMYSDADDKYSDEEKAYAESSNPDAVILYNYFNNQIEIKPVEIVVSQDILESSKTELSKLLSKYSSEKQDSINKLLNDSQELNGVKIRKGFYTDISDVINSVKDNGIFIKYQNLLKEKGVKDNKNTLALGLYLLEINNQTDRIEPLLDSTC